MKRKINSKYLQSKEAYFNGYGRGYAKSLR